MVAVWAAWVVWAAWICNCPPPEGASALLLYPNPQSASSAGFFLVFLVSMPTTHHSRAAMSLDALKAPSHNGEHFHRSFSISYPALSYVKHTLRWCKHHSPSIPLPVLMLLGTIAIALSQGMDDVRFVRTLNEAFGRNMGYFTVIFLASFFIAAAISTTKNIRLGHWSTAISPFTGAAMVCPDTSYATLLSVSQGVRWHIAIGSYAGFKLLVPAGPLMIGIALSADVHAPRFILMGLVLTLITLLVGLACLQLKSWDTTDTTDPTPDTSLPSTPPRIHAQRRGLTTLQGLFPLVCLATLLATGFTHLFAGLPTVQWMTSPIGALIVTAVATYFWIPSSHRTECITSALRRTAPLLLMIGAATAFGGMLVSVIPMPVWDSQQNDSHTVIVVLAMLFGLTALFKLVNGSSLATFAAVPAVLLPWVQASGIDSTVATYAICLGSFVAILPNDSYFWLTQAQNAGTQQQAPVSYALTGISVVQGVTGFLCLCLYTFLV